MHRIAFSFFLFMLKLSMTVEYISVAKLHCFLLPDAQTNVILLNNQLNNPKDSTQTPWEIFGSYQRCVELLNGFFIKAKWYDKKKFVKFCRLKIFVSLFYVLYTYVIFLVPHLHVWHNTYLSPLLWLCPLIQNGRSMGDVPNSASMTMSLYPKKLLILWG